MKQTALLICAFFSLLSLQAQAPNKFNYQGVARQVTGEVMPNRIIGIRANILSDSPDGSVQYSETHTVTTNQLGLFVLPIGGGIVISGDFEDIIWDGKDNFLKIEIDPNGGNDYSFNGTTQLLSVPYAIHSQNTSEIGGNAVSPTLPTDGQVLKWDDDTEQWVPADGSQNIAYTAGAGIAIDAGNTIINTSPDQPISMTGGGAINVTGTYPNFTIETPAPIDNSTTNEIQTLSLNGDTLSLSSGGGSVQLPVATPVAGPGISIAGNVISNTGDLNPNDDLTNTSNAGGDVTGTFNNLNVTRLQGNPISNITPLNDEVLKWNGASWISQPDENTIYSGGSGISINGDLISNTGDLDNDPTNELQQLNYSGQILSISNSNSIELPWMICNNSAHLNSNLSKVNIGLDCNSTTTLPLNIYFGLEVQAPTTPLLRLKNSTNNFSYVIVEGVAPNNVLFIAPESLNGGIELTNTGDVRIRGANFTVDNTCRMLTSAYVDGSNINNGSVPDLFFGNSSTGEGIGSQRTSGTNQWGLDFYTNSTKRMVILNGGNIGIGTSSPAFKLEVNGTAAKPGGGSWTATSDIRLKQNIRPYSDGLNTLLRINPVTYHYNEKSGYNTDPEHIGVIAQELQSIAPYMVTESVNKADNNTSYLIVDNSSMTYMLINAVKEQQTMIDELQKENAALKTQFDKISHMEVELQLIKSILRAEIK